MSNARKPAKKSDVAASAETPEALEAEPLYILPDPEPVEPAEEPDEEKEPGPDPTWIRNDSPQGDLDVPLLGNARVLRGEAIKVSRAHADRLTLQDIWTEVPAPDPAADPATDGTNGENA